MSRFGERLIHGRIPTKARYETDDPRHDETTLLVCAPLAHGEGVRGEKNMSLDVVNPVASVRAAAYQKKVFWSAFDVLKDQLK
jgi:hypothetical protein